MNMNNNTHTYIQHKQTNHLSHTHTETLMQSMHECNFFVWWHEMPSVPKTTKTKLHDCHAALEPSSLDLAALAALDHTFCLCLCFCIGDILEILDSFWRTFKYVLYLHYTYTIHTTHTNKH